MTSDSAFRAAIEHTRALSPATFDQWFAGVAFDDLTDGVLTLRAQNEFILEWVHENFMPVIVRKLRDITESSIQVRWVVDANLTDPISAGRVEPPIRTTPTRASDLPPSSSTDLTADGVPREAHEFYRAL